MTLHTALSFFFSSVSTFYHTKALEGLLGSMKSLILVSIFLKGSVISIAFSQKFTKNAKIVLNV